MIAITALIRAKADQADAAAAVLAAVANAVGEDEPRTLAYTVARSRSDPSEFTVFELYPDEAAFEEHKKGRAYTQVQAPIRGMLDGTPTMVRADVLATAR